jgi:hypothetical protein
MCPEIGDSHRFKAFHSGYLLTISVAVPDFPLAQAEEDGAIAELVFE